MIHQFDNVGAEETYERPTWKHRASFAFYAIATVVCSYLLVVAVLALEHVK